MKYVWKCLWKSYSKCFCTSWFSLFSKRMVKFRQCLIFSAAPRIMIRSLTLYISIEFYWNLLLLWANGLKSVLKLSTSIAIRISTAVEWLRKSNDFETLGGSATSKLLSISDSLPKRCNTGPARQDWMRWDFILGLFAEFESVFSLVSLFITDNTKSMTPQFFDDFMLLKVNERFWNASLASEEIKNHVLTSRKSAWKLIESKENSLQELRRVRSLRYVVLCFDLPFW